MNKQRPPKSMKQVRSMRDVSASSAGPADEQTLYIELHRLLTEKQRLENELRMWQANVDRINSRLVEIEATVVQVRASAAELASRAVGERGSQDPWEEMTFTYGGS